MSYSDNVIEDVRYGNDIVDVVSSYNISLKQRGSNFLGLCPFHNEKTPSFSVSSDKQMFKCFGCGEGGNVFSFVMKMDNIEFKEALMLLADRINYKLPQESGKWRDNTANINRERYYEINKLAARYFYDCLMNDTGKSAREYLKDRRISDKTIVKYGLGYAPNTNSLFTYLTDLGYSETELQTLGLIVKSKTADNYFDRFFNRLMFPILDERGNVTGFGGRILNKGEPKYLNSKETPVFDKSKNLYGINIAKRNRNRELILVEGYMDVITLFQGGVENVVAALGTAFNQSHIRLLKKYCDSVILAFDSDTAGVTATLKAIPLITQNGLRVKVLSTDGAKDPDEYIKQFGSDKLREQIDNAKSHITFQIECLLKKYDINKPEESVMFTTEAVKILSDITSAIEQNVYLQQITKLTGISEDAIKTELAKAGTALAPKTQLRRPRQNTEPGKPNKGVTEAYRRLLLIIAFEPHICTAVKEYLKPDEIHIDIYGKMLTEITKIHAKGAVVYPAELSNHFETPEEQKIVADVFFAKDDSYTAATEKEVNELVKTIKKYHIKQQSAAPDDEKALETLINMQSSLSNLYIKISDG